MPSFAARGLALPTRLFTLTAAMLVAILASAAPNARAERLCSTASATPPPGGGWFGAPTAPVQSYHFATGFENAEPDQYGTTRVVGASFSPTDTRDTVPGALFAFGDWNAIMDVGVTNDQGMQVINSSVIENNAADANGGSQSVFVNGSGVGAQSAGYTNQWASKDVSGQHVTIGIDMRVSNPDVTTPGLWGLSLFSSDDANGGVTSFGGIGFASGKFYLSQDGETISGSAIGTGNYDTWTRLGLDFDFAARTFDASVNGVNVATGVAFNPAATGNIIGSGTFGQGSSGGTTENAHFDNYAISFAGTPVAAPEADSGLLAATGVLIAAGGAMLARRRKTA